MIDQKGKIVWAARYDIFGKTLKFPVNEVDQPLRLQGQFFDEETGLHYNRFRYYCPEIGAFVSQDPLGLAAGENVYGFGPNALGWVDPLGLACEHGKLKKTGPNTWESGGGLEYGPDPRMGNRVKHVLHHATDNPGRPGRHGVFDAGRKGTLRTVDEAWSMAQKGGSNVTVSTQGTRTVYDVDMGKRIGYVGGQGGAAIGNPAINTVRIVVEGTNKVVTAFPL